MKKHNRGSGSLSLALAAVLLLIVAPTQAQEAAAAEPIAAEPAGVTVTSSQTTTQVSGSTTSTRTSGTVETVTFSGDVVINAMVVTDPAVPTGVTLFVDCKALRGVGDTTGTVYVNSCEANVTRLFRKTDRVTLTFAYFEDQTDSFLKAKTGVLTLNLTYDEATRTLTGATGTVGTLDATAAGTL